MHLRYSVRVALRLAFVLVLAGQVQSQEIRHVTSLDQGWRFTPSDDPTFKDPGFRDSAWQKVNVPHTWNVEDPFDDEPGYRRAPSWYRRKLVIPAAIRRGRVFIYFEGANQRAEVFLNGRPVGRHVGGYSAFAFDLTEYLVPGPVQTLAVRVDNSHDVNIPPLSGDFNMYGGIYRNVWLIATNSVHFKLDEMAPTPVEITTPEVSAASAVINVKGTVVNKDTRPVAAEISTRVFDRKRRVVALNASRTQVAAGAEASFDHPLPRIASPRLWSPDDPYLYSVETTIRVADRAVDQIVTPTGLRYFRFDAATGFHFNGKHLKLRGTNRHQDYKGLGNALPDRLHVRDMELIKDAGFNFVRLAHYPQDPAVLEAADRLGLLIWEETPLVNYITDSPEFTANATRMLREMIRQHRNHSSIIMWGYMNEIFLLPRHVGPEIYPPTVKLAKQLDAIAREEDPTRVTATAFHGNEVYNKEGIGDIAQITGWNLYNGWYSGVFEDFGKFMDEQHRRFPDRKLFISEYGANGDQRLHSASPRRFDSTTEWQRMFHESHLRQINERPYIAGSAIWNQFDFGSEFRGETIPHLNQKGMFTFDRVPKDIHFFYKASFSDQPVLHIAVDDRKHLAGDPEAFHNIDAYLNLPDAELFVNGVSAGKKQNDGARKVSWSVRLRAGANRLEARGSRNGRRIVDSAIVNYRPITINSPEILVNVGSNADFTDAENRIWLADRGYARGSWGFVGERSKFIYSQPPDRNIVGTLDDPLFQTMQEGLAAYRFDVPAGQYEIELLFAETRHDEPGKRVFSVNANGLPVLDSLDLAKDPGRSRVYTRQFHISAANDGITITFLPKIGEPVLSGIRLRRLQAGK